MKNQLPYYFRMFIALAYIVLGLVFLTTPAGEMVTNNKNLGLVLGLGCIAYGIFRGYRNQKRWDKPSHEED